MVDLTLDWMVGDPLFCWQCLLARRQRLKGWAWAGMHGRDGALAVQIRVGVARLTLARLFAASRDVADRERTGGSVQATGN